MLYTVRELADAIAVVDRTLRDWLAAGAPHSYDKTGHIWIEGRAFAAWIVSMRKPKRDKRLTDKEAFCMRCKEIVKLIDPIASVVRGNLRMSKGKCPKCHCRINRGTRLPTAVNNTNNTEGTLE